MCCSYILLIKDQIIAIPDDYFFIQFETNDLTVLDYAMGLLILPVRRGLKPPGSGGKPAEAGWF